MGSLAEALTHYIGQQIWVALTPDLPGKEARLIDLGSDYVLAEIDGGSYYIPFTSIVAIRVTT